MSKIGTWWQKNRVLRALFPPRVQAGDVMVFDGMDPNPFDDPPHRVVVKAVQGNWVNYRWEKGPMWQNERMTRRTFAFWYVKAA